MLMPKGRPGNLPRGWLADKLRERTVTATIADPREVDAVFDRIGIDFPRGASTVRRQLRRERARTVGADARRHGPSRAGSRSDAA